MRRRPPPPAALLVRAAVRVVEVLAGTRGRAAREATRIVVDPARQVVEYWATERATIKQGFAANFVSALTSLVAGLVLAGMAERLVSIKGLFVLIPVSVGMRGSIFGALAARLGTAIHTGLFDISRAPSGILYQNVYAVGSLTLATSVAAGVIAHATARLLGLDTAPLWDFVVISVVGGVLSSALVLVFTVGLSITSFRRGWDLDSVGAVLVTVAGDVVTLPCLLLATYLADIDIVTPLLGVIAALAGVASLWVGYKTGNDAARGIVRESFPVLCVAIVLDVLAGTVVEAQVEEVFVAYPAFLIFLPGFLENTGALGSILAARLGSKLHLGVVGAHVRPGAPAILDGSIVAGLGVFLFTVSAVGTLVVAEAAGEAYPGVASFLGAAMLGGMLGLAVAALIGYYAAVGTFHAGLDPDNHTIPLVTSGMDLLGAICLVAAVAVLGIS